MVVVEAGGMWRPVTSSDCSMVWSVYPLGEIKSDLLGSPSGDSRDGGTPKSQRVESQNSAEQMDNKESSWRVDGELPHSQGV